MMLTWLLIAVLICTGWYGYLGWGQEHIEAVCLLHNSQLMEDGKQGPLQACR